jgi:PilZ domain
MDDRRRKRRARGRKGTKIIFLSDGAAIDCVVRNVSATGAHLVAARPLGIPETFDLILDAGQTRIPCKTRRHKADRIGVQFQRSQSRGPLLPT